MLVVARRTRMAGRLCAADAPAAAARGVCGSWWDTAVTTVRNEGVRVYL